MNACHEPAATATKGDESEEEGMLEDEEDEHPQSEAAPEAAPASASSTRPPSATMVTASHCLPLINPCAFGQEDGNMKQD